MKNLSPLVQNFVLHFGEMGSRWGINRTVGQIYALLYVSDRPLNADEIAETIINAGSVFIGNYSCESAGDYASGTNHTLPTGGAARAYSGVSVASFTKSITFQRLTAEGIQNLGPTIETMAAAEGLDAHKNAVAIRREWSGGGNDV